MGSWGRRAALVAACVVLLGACGEGAGPTGPAAELADAVEQTLAVDSMVLTLIVEDADGAEPETVTTEYVAPDRARTTGPGTRTLTVDGALYLWTPDEDGEAWVKRDSPKVRRPPAELFPLLQLQDPDEVARDGDDYVATLPGRPAGSARVRLEDGYVVRIATTYPEHGTSVMTLGAFDEPVDPIEPPPADQVVDMSTSTSISPDAKPATLPEPEGSTSSTLQLRPVVGEAEACAATETNPPKDQPATLIDRDGACLALERAGLEIVRVASIEAFERDGQIELAVTLDQSDAAALDRLAADSYGRQLAMVAFGSVLTAPTIHADRFDGKAVVTGVSPQMAARLIAALRP